MSESESIAPRVSEDNVPVPGVDDLAQRLNARAVPEREGLPRNYRMRADAHYVEQLESRAQPVIRLVATAQIEGSDLPPPDRVEALTKSIAAHGLLQPLMVRKHGERYMLIAGRKRLAAVTAAGLRVVPCLLHDVDGPAAAALAEADNLRVEELPDTSHAERDALRPVLEAVTSDLSIIRTSITLLRTTRQGLPQQVGADLIETQASRAAWLLSCMRGTFEHTRLTPVGAIVQRVSDAFDAHATLTGLQLDCSVTPAAAVWKLPEEAATAAISGALFATLSCLEDVAKPRVELHVDAPQTRTLKIEVVQRAVRVPLKFREELAELDLGRPEVLIPALALRMARAVAAPYGGTAEMTALPGAGSVLQITFQSALPTA